MVIVYQLVNLKIRLILFHVGAISFATLATIFILATEKHKHNERPDLYKFRSKPYHWSCNDCSLFEQDCWDECKGRKKHDDHHH